MRGARRDGRGARRRSTRGPSRGAIGTVIDADAAIVDDGARGARRGAARVGRARRRERAAILERGRRARARRATSCRAPARARPARRCPTRSPKCARPSTSAATTPRRRARSSRAARAARAHRRVQRALRCTAAACSCASARGTSRSRSSPARWPRRSPPATPSSPSRPSRRRSSPRSRVELLLDGGRARRRRSHLLPGTRRGRRRGARRAIRASPASPSPARPRSPRAIDRALAARDGPIVPLIAETGGLNAMIVDARALPEQVVADVIVSAFDSAGQRCSALRVLCVQHEIAPRVLALLEGAMDELARRRSGAAGDRRRSRDRRARRATRSSATSRRCDAPRLAAHRSPLPRAPRRARSSRPRWSSSTGSDATRRARSSARCCTS